MPRASLALGVRTPGALLHLEEGALLTLHRISAPSPCTGLWQEKGSPCTSAQPFSPRPNRQKLCLCVSGFLVVCF